MRGQVPDHAHVGLVKPQVHAARRDEEELPQRAGDDQVVDGDDGRAVEERVARHEHESTLRRIRHELGRLRHRGGQRLLDEDVLPGPERRHADRVVRRDRRCDEDRFDVVRREQIVELVRRAHAGIATPDQRQPLGVEVADRDELGAVELCEVPDEVRAPVAQPHDRHAYGRRHGHAVDRRCRRSAKGVLKSRRRSRPSDQPLT